MKWCWALAAVCFKGKLLLVGCWPLAQRSGGLEGREPKNARKGHEDR